MSKARTIFSKFLDYLGAFALSCFLCVNIFLSFIVQAFDNCIITDALIVFAKCHGFFLSGVAETILNYFSVFSIGIMMLTGYSVFVSLVQFKIVQFIMSLAISLLYLLVVFSVFRFLFKAVKKVFRSKQDIKYFKTTKAVILASIIFLPSITLASYRMYLTPSIIVQDMWHDTFEIPKSKLVAWNYKDIQKPDKDRLHHPTSYFHYVSDRIIERGQARRPFFILKEELGNMGAENIPMQEISIKVTPHFDVLDDGGLQSLRNQYFQKEVLEQKTYIGQLSKGYSTEMYQNPTIENGFEVYRSIENGRRTYVDYYVLRDENQNIQNILHCTSEKACSEPRGHNSYAIKTCKTDEDPIYKKGLHCRNPNCKRFCTDASLGNNRYFFTYSFSKDHLGQYSEIHSSIENHIRSFLLEPKKNQDND